MKKIVKDFKKKPIDTTIIERRLTTRAQNMAQELTKIKEGWNNSTYEVVSRDNIIETLESVANVISDMIERCPTQLDTLEKMYECYFINEQYKLRLKKLKEE